MYSAIVFLPLLGAIIAGIIAIFGAGARHPGAEPPVGDDAHGGRHGDAAHHEAHEHGEGEHHPAAQGSLAAELVTSGLLVVSAILSWVSFYQVALGDGEAFTVPVFTFIHSGALEADWAFRIDALTAVMLVVVNTVSALVHIYSIGYMAHDPHQPRFFSYLSFFTFAMLMLVTADNLVQMFFGWEGVGLASYLLIGFWYHRPSANAAAIKAFIVNRVGDFGFALGIFGVFWLFSSIDLGTIFANAESVAEGEAIALHIFGQSYDGQGAITVVCLLLFMGAMGKSAQVPLHTWLPDAMEGPTPVSALIHAATMVTAGVFMAARLSPIFELSQTALNVVVIVGAFTAFFAATVGLVQNDIKRVVAYSTCSQLGYMFAALGVGAYPVAIFHLFTHAFFKALLFLGSGSVIHAVADEQDMRRMGGLYRLIPVTYAMMLAGTLSLTGFPLTAGYFSKDAIVEATHAAASVGVFAFLLLVVSAAFTSFYSWRLVFMTFHGEPRAPKEVMDHAHESPQVMLVPLYILAAGALFAGLIFAASFIGEDVQEFWKGSLVLDEHLLEEMHHTSFWIAALPTVAMILGFLVAYQFYIRRPDLPAYLAEEQQVLYRFLLNKWYFDEVYDALFVRPAMRLGRFLWKRGDGWLIDGFGPDGVSARVIDVTRNVVRLQTGYLYHYAFAMLLGIAILVTWMMFAG
ncbi:MAG: NADH-quinone oxidoreductase subunit L [Propylenella sp.]